MPTSNPISQCPIHKDGFGRVDVNLEPCVSLVSQKLQARGNRNVIARVGDREQPLSTHFNDVLKLGGGHVCLAKGLTHLQEDRQNK
jgi:hypothetical protein